MTGLRLFAIALIACFALTCAAAQTGAEQSKTLPDVPAQYELTAFGDSASVAGRIFPLKIYNQELTSDGDIEELASTLRHKGQDGLAGALDRTNCKGRIEGTGSVGNQVRFVRIRAVNDGGQHIVLAAARPGWRLLHNGAPDIYKISVLISTLTRMERALARSRPSAQ